jgi:hypothetical protein
LACDLPKATAAPCSAFAPRANADIVTCVCGGDATTRALPVVTRLVRSGRERPEKDSRLHRLRNARVW